MVMLDQVDFVSTNRLESMQGDPSWAVISITDPGTSVARVHPDFGPVLRLSFDDLDHGNIVNGCAGRQFGLHEFRQVMAWLDTLKANPCIRGVLVQCEAGRSRSAAMAVFISGVYGAKFANRRRVDGFNELVLSMFETMTQSKVGRPQNWIVMPGDVISRA